MAKPKKPSETPAEELTGVDLEGMYTGAELSPALASAMAELGIEDEGQIKLYVYRLLEDGREARIWEGPPADYDLSSLSKRFGSGDYRVRLYAPMLSGKMVKRGQKDFPMMLEPQEDAALEQKRRPVAAPGETTSAADIARMVAEAIKSSQPDPFATMKMLMETVGGMMKNLLPPPAPATPAPAPLAGFSDVLQAVKSFIETSRVVAPAMPMKDGEADVSGLALARGVDLFAKMMEKAMSKNGSATPVLAQDVTQQPLPLEMTSEETEMLQMWHLQLKMANRSAAAGISPKDFAESVYSVVPDTIIAGMASDPQWFKLICANVPECQSHEAWYNDVRNELILLAVEDGILTRDEKGNISVSNGTDRESPAV